MARFYGSMKGNSSESTRRGTAKSGLEAHIRGWELGIQVELTDESGVDVIRVYRTSGSNKRMTRDLIAEFSSPEKE